MTSFKNKSVNYLNVVVDGRKEDDGVTSSHVRDDLGGGLFDWHDVQET